MATIIKKGMSRSRIDELLEKVEKGSRKGFEAKKFCGILKQKEDPSKAQKRLRDEWQ